MIFYTIIITYTVIAIAVALGLAAEQGLDITSLCVAKYAGAHGVAWPLYLYKFLYRELGKKKVPVVATRKSSFPRRIPARRKY